PPCTPHFLPTPHASHLPRHSFPTRRSSDLRRRIPSKALSCAQTNRHVRRCPHRNRESQDPPASPPRYRHGPRRASFARSSGFRRSESTRLNSSHDQTSYAVFCLKKKNQLTN